MKYAWIRSQEADHGVRTLCRALRVSPSGYYAWRGRRPSARELADQQLGDLIEALHHEFREAYGTERMWRELRERGIRCGRHRVARLRRERGVVTRRRRRYLRSRAPVRREAPAPNRQSWPLATSRPNQVWAVDITHIPTRRGWLYLAAVLDQCSRRVVGWSMDTRPNQELANSALEMAVVQRRPPATLIHHSDQGSVYTSASYRQLLDRQGITASMSRVAMPYDNAMVESFFSSLKSELTHHERFETPDQARSAVFSYIETFYNPRRRHQGLGYRSPIAFEAELSVPSSNRPRNAG